MGSHHEDEHSLSGQVPSSKLERNKISYVCGAYQERTIQQLSEEPRCIAQRVLVCLDKRFAFVKHYDDLIGSDIWKVSAKFLVNIFLRTVAYIPDEGKDGHHSNCSATTSTTIPDR